jgi:hypothetical protein
VRKVDAAPCLGSFDAVARTVLIFAFCVSQCACRGRAALTDCHYLSKSLGARHLAGHYLGCAMSDSVREAVHGLFEVIKGDGAVRVRGAAAAVLVEGRVGDVGVGGSTEETPNPDSVFIAKVCAVCCKCFCTFLAARARCSGCSTTTLFILERLAILCGHMLMVWYTSFARAGGPHSGGPGLLQ